VHLHRLPGKPSITAQEEEEEEEEEKPHIVEISLPFERARAREKECLAHYTAVISSSSPGLFSGIKTGCKCDS